MLDVVSWDAIVDQLIKYDDDYAEMAEDEMMMIDLEALDGTETILVMVGDNDNDVLGDVYWVLARQIASRMHPDVLQSVEECRTAMSEGLVAPEPATPVISKSPDDMLFEPFVVAKKTPEATTSTPTVEEIPFDAGCYD